MGVNDVVVLKYRLGGDRYDKLLYYASTFMFMTKNDIFNLFSESVKNCQFIFIFVCKVGTNERCIHNFSCLIVSEDKLIFSYFFILN